MMKRLGLIVVVAATAALVSAPVAAAQPFQSVSVNHGAVLLAVIAPNDGRNTQLLLVGNDARFVSGGVGGSGGSFQQSVAFIDGGQQYCDVASNTQIFRSINGGNFDLPASDVTVRGSGTAGLIRTVMTDVFVSEAHFTFPGPGCTGLDPVLTRFFGTTTVTLDVAFNATGNPRPSQPVTEVFSFGPGLGVAISVNNLLDQIPAALSGTIHSTDPNWDLGEISSVPTPLCFITLQGRVEMTVITP